MLTETAEIANCERTVFAYNSVHKLQNQQCTPHQGSLHNDEGFRRNCVILIVLREPLLDIKCAVPSCKLGMPSY